MDEQTGTVLKIAWSNGNLLEGEVTTTQASAIVTRCGEDVTEEYPASAFAWKRDSGNAEADATWNAAHAGVKSITFAAADIDGDVKISCTLTGNSATYGSITVDDDLDASHTPAELDANDVFVIEDGYLKVMTSRGEVYTLENSTLKAAGAKLNGSIMAETKLFASQPEDIVEFSYNHNGLRTQKKVTKADGTVETTDYTLHGKRIEHLRRGNDEMHIFYDAHSRPAMVEFNNTLYSYIHNLQGDIAGIIDSNGDVVVEYRYDAWDKPVVVRTLTTVYEALAKLNPFRYRGYAFDEETDLYYLRSRYYSFEYIRFINADYLNIKRTIGGNNLFSYCSNNSVLRIDPSGKSWLLAIFLIGVAVSLSGCSSQATPREDIAAAADLDIHSANHYSYNCYGNAINKCIATNPTGYEIGMSTADTFELVKADLGGDANVRKLESIDDPIEDDEYKVAMKCGPDDYHFIRLTDDGWYNKSGRTEGLYVSQEIVESEVWYAMYMDGNQAYTETRIAYTDETIYFAVKEDWDE